MQTTIDILRGARALIAQGWCQHYATLPKPGGGVLYCPTAALQRFPDDFRALRLLRKAAQTDLLTVWNDAPGRTQTEVVAIFDRAISESE